ncbi:hypothetical protein FRC04_009888 [Tulasnella sp. 424]|nr:hypothetical protein FRC04_009888 [Tulasnella sp. 424]
MTRTLPVKPIVDEANPLWYPKISRKMFLSHIARENKAASEKDNCTTFALKLSKGLRDITNDSDAPEAHGTDEKPFREPRKSFAAQEKTLRPIKQRLAKSMVPHPLKPLAANVSADPVPWRPSFPRDLAPHRKRKLPTPPYETPTDSDAESVHDDLLGPSKRIKSTDSYDSSSFMLSDRAEALKLQVDAFQTSEISIPEDLGPKGGRRVPQTCRVKHPGANSKSKTTTDINSLVEQLDDVVDYLSENGLLTRHSLSLFRGAHVDSITMTESLDTFQGLNEGGRDALRDNLSEVFEQPSDFLSLATLDLSSVPLPRSTITFLVSLPALTDLFLDYTDIDDSCIFPLTALRSPLRMLTLSGNLGITDASLIALAFLEHLSLTNLKETSVTMSGLRRFARALHERLDSEYCVDYEVKFPIIAQPSQCHGLTLASIKKNLKIHSNVNKGITLRGSEAQLRTRLEEILTIREDDLRLRQYLEP